MAYSDKIEKIVDGFIDRKVAQLNPPDINSYLNFRNAQINDPRSKYILQNIYAINDRISSLVTHVSAMIAALGIILIVFEESKATQAMIFVEIVFYSIFAVISIYCLRHGGSVPKKLGNNDEEYLDHQYKYYLNRRYEFTVCSYGVLLTTLLFILTIVFHLFAIVMMA